MLLFALDRFPVELIYLICEYLSGDDILYSFLHTSAYMNEVLKSYDEFPLNLISNTRQKFDWIVSYVKSDRILSLTLSDRELTVGQVDLFLNHYASTFALFTRLYSFTLQCTMINQEKYNLLIQALKDFSKFQFII